MLEAFNNNIYPLSLLNSINKEFKKIQEDLKGIYPGVSISVEKDAAGPPAGYPINIELEGKDYNELISTAEKMRDYINSKSIEGIDELKIDVNKSKPSMIVNIDRKKAGCVVMLIGFIQ